MRRRYVGKRELKRARPRLSRIWIPVLTLFLLAGSVMAYLSTSAEPVSNTLQRDTSVNPAVTETFDTQEKTNVKVDVGSPGYAVYVRAAVVVTWKNAFGEVWSAAPAEGTDYTITYNSTDWQKGSDGFWYHSEPVTHETEVLIHSCAPVAGRAPENYTLSVEILAQTVQALGTTDAGDVPAVQDAWGAALGGTNIISAP